MINISYQVIFSNQAHSFIKKADTIIKKRLKEAIMELSSNPYSIPFKKIKGKQGIYRIRVGNYRILYEIISDRRIINILKIDHRKKVYD